MYVKNNWAPGDPITEALLDHLETQYDEAIITAGTKKVVRKTADETVNNSDVLQNDDELFKAVAANEVWYVFGFLRVISLTATPDIKIAFTVPAAGSFEWLIELTNLTPTFSTTGNRLVTLAADVESGVSFFGIYIGGANAGNLQLQWAQHTTTAEDTKVLANSFLLCHKLA